MKASTPKPIKETAGQQCARWLKAAKLKARETNTVLGWDQVAKIIDATLESIGCFKPVKAQNSEVSAKPTPEAIYEAYPRKVGRKAAIDAINRAIERHKAEEGTTPATPYLLDRTTAFAAAVAGWPADERNFVPHPATWFNQGRYDDDPKEWLRGKPLATSTPKDYTKL